MQDKTTFIETLGNVMTYMSHFGGGLVPDEASEEYEQWRQFIQVKYEETSRRGFWRRLLTKDTLSLEAGDTEVYLPVRFGRPNALYVLVVNGIDLANPDRLPDKQDIEVVMDNQPTIVVDEEEVSNPNFGRWKLIFNLPIESAEDALIWYFATPPKPINTTDKILLPGDMIAYGALAEHFRVSGLLGNLDDARLEYENRLQGYLAMEMIPPRHELVTFETNPRQIDRLRLAKSRYRLRPDRISRSF